MPKTKLHAVVTAKTEKLTIEIDRQAIDRKIRRPGGPASRPHRNKTKYTRKLKHPKKTQE